MAEGGDGSRDPIRCGDCLEEEGYLLNPKEIPCSHIFCEECIRGHLKSTDIFICKICKVESTFVVEDLPSALTHPTFCDVCEKKGKKNMTAKAYCASCKRKYCGRHEETHSDLNEHHQVLTIENYLKSDHAVEQKLCVKHEDQPLMIGCSMCLEIYCAKCVSSMGSCSNGGSHALMALDELSAECKDKLEPQKTVAEDKLTEWTAMIEELSDSVANWDKETEEGLRLIDETENTQADVVVKKKDIESMNGGFLKENFPSLRLEDQQKLVATDNRRKAEIELVPSEPLLLGDHVKDNETIPSAIQLIRQVTTSSYCCSTVCHYKGYVYVGLYCEGIDRIDEQGKVTSSFIKLLENFIVTVRAHNDQLYILMYEGPYNVYVYDLTGTHIRSWDHGDMSASCSGNKLTFMDDNLLIADVINKRISVYTTAGHTVRQIPCPAISADTDTAMCAGGDDCVIVSQDTPSRIHKFNLTSGAIEWTSDKITKPNCVEYSPPVVLISGNYSSSTRVWVLDYKTGDLLRELSHHRDDAEPSWVDDMCIFDGTLLVPRFSEACILYYKVETEQKENEN